MKKVYYPAEVNTIYSFQSNEDFFNHVVDSVLRLTEDQFHKLKEKAKSFTVYLDMDGCLTNFSKAAQHLHPDFWAMQEQWMDRTKRDKDYHKKQKELRSAVESTIGFWENLEWMEDGQQLLDFVTSVFPSENICVLTAPMPDPNCPIGKLKWIKNNTPLCETRFICHQDKYEFVNHHNPNTKQILIDDLYENIKGWNDHGGYGIQHTNTETTIKAIIQLLSK